MAERKDNGKIHLDHLDVDIVLALAYNREHDEQFLTPKMVFENLSPKMAEGWTARKLAGRLRELEQLGVVERNRWIKGTKYREGIGARIACTNEIGSFDNFVIAR